MAAPAKVRPRSTLVAVLLVLGKILLVLVAVALGVIAAVSAALYEMLSSQPKSRRRYTSRTR